MRLKGKGGGRAAGRCQAFFGGSERGYEMVGLDIERVRAVCVCLL